MMDDTQLRAFENTNPNERSFKKVQKKRRLNGECYSTGKKREIPAAELPSENVSILWL